MNNFGGPLRSLGFTCLAGLCWGASVTVGLFTMIFFFYFIFATNEWWWSLFIGPLGTAATIGLWVGGLFTWDES